MKDKVYVQKKNFADFQIWKGKVPILNSLDIELTERCNNACTHCYINKPLLDTDSEARELTTAQWQHILQQAATLGALSVRMTGGEILVREDFTEIYLAARNLGLSVRLLTNGRRITPELAELWARIPPLHPIEITTYGMRQSSYDATACSTGAYEEYLSGIKNLEACNVPFIVKGTVLPTNKDDVEAFEKWAATIPWMSEPPQYSLLLDFRARRDSVAKNRVIATQRLSPKEAVGFLNKYRPSTESDLIKFAGMFLHPAKPQLFGCGAGNELCVDAFGQLLPCMQLRMPEMTYDLKHGTLGEGIIEVRRRVAAVKATDPQYLTRCSRCFLRPLCDQCPAKAWLEHGTLDRPVEYLCEVTHEHARVMGLLVPGEYSWEVVDGYERVKTMLKENEHDATIEHESRI